MSVLLLSCGINEDFWELASCHSHTLWRKTAGIVKKLRHCQSLGLSSSLFSASRHRQLHAWDTELANSLKRYLTITYGDRLSPYVIVKYRLRLFAGSVAHACN